jgi:hypothetical protein
MPRLLMEDVRKEGWDPRVESVAGQQRAYLITGSLPGQPAFSREFEVRDAN